MSTRRTARRHTIQILFVIALLAVAAGILVVVANFISSTLGASRGTPTATSSACPFRSGCTEKSIDQISRDTGFTFPAGSTVIWSYEETSWFDKSWAVRALVKMPPRSPIPESTALNATASIRKDDSSGVEVEVSLLDPAGR